LFIGGLASHTTRETLKSHFEKYGAVQDSILMVDRVSGRSRCFGFITMQDPQTLDTILAQSQILDGKKVDCKRAVPREQSHGSTSSSNLYYKTKKMFVGGLPPDVTDESFRSFFEQFGTIEDSVVILDKDTGRPRGFGFITFASEDTADKVLENYEKNCINGKWVECKKATPRQTQGGFSNYSVPYGMYSNYSQPYFFDYYPREYYAAGYQTPLYGQTPDYMYPNYFQSNNEYQSSENPK
jgi:RNA-binding protein Musashi